MYNIDIILTQEMSGDIKIRPTQRQDDVRVYPENESYTYRLSGEDLEQLKEDAFEAVYQGIELNDIVEGYVLMEIIITDDEGEFVDSDETEVFVEYIERTSEPSKLVAWGEGQKPHLFTVDREQSLVWKVTTFV